MCSTVRLRIYKRSRYGLFKMKIWEHALVAKTKSCWVWGGALTKGGYGKVKIKGKTLNVHRLAFAQKHAYLPKQVCHKCDVRNCLRPSHLFPGDAFLNQQDSVFKKRNRFAGKTHCAKGHPLSGTNVYRNPKHWGNGRACKQCRYQANREWYARKK